MIILLVYLLIFCVVFWAARSLMAAFGIGEPLSTVVIVVLVIIGVILLIQALGGGSGLSLPSLR